MSWLEANPNVAEAIEEPSESFVEESSTAETVDRQFQSMTADETKRRLTAHYRIDRSQRLRAAKIKVFEKVHSRIYCENCSFDFEHKYGERGRGYIEVHHRLPLAAVLPNTITNLTDLMLVCSNCHRMVHRSEPILSPQELQSITRF
ncbi:MAG: HNH endonuclease [Terriglobia bacterium]